MPSEYPRLTLILLTYEPGGDKPRATAEPVLRAFLDFARYSGPINVHIADDGSVAGHVDRLREIAAGYATVGTVGSTNAERRGYGRSYNLATQAVHVENGTVVVLEDDWLLTRPLDFEPLVRTLWGHDGGPAGGVVESDRDLIDCIRLGYLGFTQRLRGEFVHTPAGVMALLGPDSDEPHVAAGHARIETMAYERRVGPWPEGLAPGATEFEWTRRIEARRGVAWPLELTWPSQRADSLFVHIGTTELGEVEPER